MVLDPKADNEERAAYEMDRALDDGRALRHEVQALRGLVSMAIIRLRADTRSSPTAIACMLEELLKDLDR